MRGAKHPAGRRPILLGLLVVTALAVSQAGTLIGAGPSPGRRPRASVGGRRAPGARGHAVLE